MRNWCGATTVALGAVALGLVCATALCAATPRAHAAEPPEQAVYLGLSAGVHLRLDDWDLNESLRSTSRASVAAPLFALRIGAIPAWFLSLEATLGVVPYWSSSDDLNVALQYDFDVLVHPFRWSWQPFLDVGVGAYHNVAGDHGTDIDGEFHWGLGVRGWLLDGLALRIEARHVVTDSQSRKKIAANNLEVLVGVDFMLWRGDIEPDTDGDEIPDAEDACPEVPGLAAFNGCPDTDHDGITDADDACPKVAGPPETKGCPDTDGDGVIDKDDKCPKVAGPPETNGCPDTDGDGVLDKDDKCPKVAGLADLKGCPDKDGDGVADGDDKCPDQPGPASNGGCPVDETAKPVDTDGDGLYDNEDDCPNERGVASNRGCPRTFDGKLHLIHFDDNSGKIRGGSIAKLDEVVATMKAYPRLMVRAEGHADARASSAYNLQLSQERADAVRGYLVAHGIRSARIEVIAKGEDHPLAPNDTEAGRALNRRVELVVTSR